MTSNDEIRDSFRFCEIGKECPGLDEEETGELYTTTFHKFLMRDPANYKRFFGSIDNTSYLAWTENILNVDFYYSLGMITLEITFKNNEKIEVTLDEIYSQNKMRIKMEEKFQVAPPILYPAEYEMAVFTIIRSAFGIIEEE